MRILQKMTFQKREWEKSLEVCAQEMRVDPNRKKASLDRIAQKARQKEIQYCPGFMEIVKVQFFSIPGNVWLLQALFLMLLPLTEAFLREKAGVYDRKIFPVLSVCMASGAVVIVNELSRHFSCRVAELEQSCYLNLSQLWLMRVCCISGLDVFTAVALGIGRARHYGVGRFSFAVYVLTPFFLANAALLAFFTLGRNGKRAGQAGVACLFTAALGAEIFCGWIYDGIWLPLWLLLLTAAVFLCVVQVCEIGKKMEGDGLCWS